ncbi:MAG: PQQ-dependent sugar dehydrogenase [Daejeonella sp.]|uniref:PQQ-dependent sugar dehydrogenase n=1 Tax=Daejeonella sp. TaxID=2805397 RepID=UPI003C766CE9
MKFLFLNIFLLITIYGYFSSPGGSGKTDPPFALSRIHNFVAQGKGLEATVIASNLEIPWEILWGPDNNIWITEQKGIVSRVDPKTGTKKVLLKLNDVWFYRTAGLLGMTIHPDMNNFPYVFLNYTFMKGEKPYSKLVRYTWKLDTLVDPKVLMEASANNGHSGSRLAFFRGKLFWATGDANNNTYAQDFNSPNGKILRLNIDGTIPADNPVKGSAVWAMGFRNIQGMVFATNGKLYTSEHGDASDDEVNLIEKTRNYGWPVVQGFAVDPKELEYQSAKSTHDPMKAWTPTIAPAGLDYYFSNRIPQWKNSLLLVSLKGKSLRSLKLNKDGSEIIDEKTFLENQFGRIRDICISPAGDVYVSTSNRDWNRSMGDPLPEDDRIIQISPSERVNVFSSAKTQNISFDLISSSALYSQYCASCHQQNGLGLAGVFPPLKGSSLVKQGELPFIKKILSGSTGQVKIGSVTYDTQMPSFAFLKDDEIAGIVNYVRNMQDEKYSPVNAESIAKARTN